MKYTLTVLVIVLLALTGIWLSSLEPTSEQPDVADSSGVVSNVEDTAIRHVITEFGTKLELVSLLASTSARTQAMNDAYGIYVAPELLAQWYPEGAEALGRYSSSPFPERIEVVEVRVNGATAIAEGNVIEVAHVEPAAGKSPAAVYPVTFTLEKRNNTWIIVGAEKGAYSTLPQRQTLVGYWECLPHKDTSGPQTMECAFGIAVDQSDAHYAVNTMLMSTYPVDFPTGTKVRVSGVVTPVEMLSSIQKYDIDGIMNATEIVKVD